jgi:hypothetical protein
MRLKEDGGAKSRFCGKSRCSGRIGKHPLNPIGSLAVRLTSCLLPKKPATLDLP